MLGSTVPLEFGALPDLKYAIWDRLSAETFFGNRGLLEMYSKDGQEFGSSISQTVKLVLT